MINSFLFISEFKFSTWLTGSHGRNSGASDIKTKACDISAASHSHVPRIKSPHSDRRLAVHVPISIVSCPVV